MDFDQDPQGVFTRPWVPKLESLSLELIQAGWRAQAHRLKQAGIALGKSDPDLRVDHAEAGFKARAHHCPAQGG